jgi:hypothetical protein
MKVFLSWSGAMSHKVAVAFRDWLPKVIQSVKPYLSSEDIAKGVRWSSDLAKELQTTSYGILCITDDNYDSPWMNFEAGALSREIEKARVTPFLFNLKPSDIRGPFTQFQAVVNERADVLRMLESINDSQTPEVRLDKQVLAEGFEVWWGKLETKLAAIARDTTTKPAKPKRTVQELVEDLLEQLSGQQREADTRWQNLYEYQKNNFVLQMNQLIQLTGTVTAVARSVESLHNEFAPSGSLFSTNPFLNPPSNLANLKDLLSRKTSPYVDLGPPTEQQAPAPRSPEEAKK